MHSVCAAKWDNCSRLTIKTAFSLPQGGPVAAQSKTRPFLHFHGVQDTQRLLWERGNDFFVVFFFFHNWDTKSFLPLARPANELHLWSWHPFPPPHLLQILPPSCGCVWCWTSIRSQRRRRLANKHAGFPESLSMAETLSHSLFNHAFEPQRRVRVGGLAGSAGRAQVYVWTSPMIDDMWMYRRALEW